MARPASCSRRRFPARPVISSRAAICSRVIGGAGIPTG
jgi:hypothetical protein